MSSMGEILIRLLMIHPSTTPPNDILGQRPADDIVGQEWLGWVLIGLSLDEQDYSTSIYSH
jgi:hypothetical protein